MHCQMGIILYSAAKPGINSGYFPAVNVREELRMRCFRLSQKKSSDSTTVQSTELQHSSPGSFNTEMSLLSSILEHDATIPHDKIFSIYPLLQFWILDLPQINYDQPFEMLCEELTRCWFNSKKNLSIILLAARLPGRDARLPSWVPNWGNRQSALDYRLAIHKTEAGNFRGKSCKHNRASNGSLLDESYGKIIGELHLRGLSLGLILRVLVCDIPGHLSDIQYPEIWTVFRAWCCSVNDSSLYSTIRESLDALRSTIYASSSNHDYKHPVFRVIYGLLYDLMLYPDCQLLDSAQAKKAYELFLKAVGGDEPYMKALNEMSDFLSTFLTDNRASLCSSLIDNWSPDLDYRSDLDFKYSMSRAYDSIILTIIRLKLRFIDLQNHSLLITENCCGLSAYTAREGDEVFLLKGLDVPVVLRPNGENYSFVGPCSYIHGVMEGQRWPEDESELQDLVLV
ncbi:uncharacterized protein EAE98_008986 [Botrytis deweyae]|uniref:Heterokaryon incompatibility domain-containing protein n=1 Tax=Botrytis deweyae TaxID=2478750 RepID=A0ABQ7ID12_9HELO|nr:uncharacterized protein EAE98_008986 [Botrytis deweyae]KAF7920293.1 hypothetical protein EAE98_008986 [Botrytis deweyae]